MANKPTINPEFLSPNSAFVEAAAPVKPLSKQEIDAAKAHQARTAHKRGNHTISL